VFQDKDGLWLWNCFAGFGEGDEITTNGAYYLSCRDSAKAFPGLSYQTASNINLALAQLGVVEAEPLLLGGKRKPDIGVFATCCGALLAPLTHS